MDDPTCEGGLCMDPNSIGLEDSQFDGRGSLGYPHLEYFVLINLLTFYILKTSEQFLFLIHNNFF